jgi:1-phosphofructokinase
MPSDSPNMAAAGQRQGIVTVTMNPAFDLTCFVPVLKLGEVDRLRAQRVDCGGKGINVACYLAGYGVPVIATGFVGDANSEPFHQLFRDNGVVDRCIAIPGSTRTNVKLVEEEVVRVTDLNAVGFAIRTEDEALLVERVGEAARNCHWVVIGGSLPHGCRTELVPLLVEAARAAGAKVMLDTSGRPLVAGLEANPDAVKPNRKELRDVLDHPIDDVVEAAVALQQRGVGTVILSMDAEGAVFTDGREIIRAVGAARSVQSTVGAGDALVAGYILGSLRGLPLTERARLGTGFALGALETVGPCLPPPETIEMLAAGVTVRRVEGPEPAPLTTG